MSKRQQDFQAALRQSSAPSSGDPGSEFQRLLTSAFADSMYQIAGKPRVVAQAPVRREGAGVGEYTLNPDSVALSPDAFYSNANFMTRQHSLVGQAPSSTPDDNFDAPESTFSHELAHRFFLRNGDALGLDAKLMRIRDSLSAVGEGVPGYGGTNGNEHDAEAMRNAIQFLRTTAGMTPGPNTVRSVAPLRSQYERSVPGTGVVLDYLLQQPLYAHHPLNTSLEIKMPQPDATSARPIRRMLGTAAPPLK